MTLAERAAEKAAAIAAVSAVEERAPEVKVIDLPLAEPMTPEVSAKYTNAEEVAEGARPIERFPTPSEAALAGPPPWTRDRLHDAAVKAHIPSTLVVSTYNEVAEGRKPSELTEADWREVALRLDLGA